MHYPHMIERQTLLCYNPKQILSECNALVNASHARIALPSSAASLPSVKWLIWQPLTHLLNASCLSPLTHVQLPINDSRLIIGEFQEPCQPSCDFSGPMVVHVVVAVGLYQMAFAVFPGQRASKCLFRHSVVG